LLHCEKELELVPMNPKIVVSMAHGSFREKRLKNGALI
jgi:hypothetical protein